MTGQANFLQSLGWAVINSLWQLALLWVVYQVFTHVFRSVKASAKSTLASSLLIAGFAWFLFTFFAALSSGATSTISVFTGDPDSLITGTWLEQTLPVASTFYLILLTIPLFRFVKNYRYVHVIRHYGLTKPNPEWKIFVSNIAARMGIRRPVQIWISEWVSSPVTIGYLKPIILIPLAAINNLGTAQMEAVLLHELSHIRRYDYLLNLVLNFIRTILYFNPFARAFVKIVETEREKSCDEMVLQFQYDSHQYASALLSLEKLSRQHQLLILAASGNRDLMHRVQSIMGIPQKKTFATRRVLASLFCILSLNALLWFSNTKHVSSAYSPGMANVVTEPLPVVYDERPIGVERNTEMIQNTARAIKETAEKRNKNHTAAAFISAVSRPDIINASYENEVVEEEVELAKIEEVQVKEAVAASRKVLENEQWKTVEKSLADVFSQQEKETLKSALREEIEKFDWKKWENKLRLAYDQVDWENVNNQLYNALTRIKTDSLVSVYSSALADLNHAQRELNRLSITGIPDSDISLKALTEKQRTLQKALLQLKSTRNKKIVHL